MVVPVLAAFFAGRTRLVFHSSSAGQPGLVCGPFHGGGRGRFSTSRTEPKMYLACQGEGSGAQYTAATAGEGRTDVRLHNPDAELDFEDRVTDHDGGTAAGAPA